VRACAVPVPPRSTSAYVAAGYTDGFFETGLSPWDVAAGSLLVTEAGGLVGNFTGDADYLYPARSGGRQSEDLCAAGDAARAVHPHDSGRAAAAAAARATRIAMRRPVIPS
jgi:myo-inositol-1(or 4)-monophosphatase